jgi:hypothetical protein
MTDFLFLLGPSTKNFQLKLMAAGPIDQFYKACLSLVIRLLNGLLIDKELAES